MTEAPPPPPGEDRPPDSTPPPPGYGPQGYAPQGYGGPVHGAPPPAAGSYASWGQRVAASLIDNFLPFIVAGIAYAISKPLGFLVYLVAIVWVVYQAYQGGQTGQSLGKRTVGLRLLNEQTGQHIGGGQGILRAILHIIDGLPCYLGYLWPLWDAKKQTFADKILTTVVVKA